MRIKSHAITNIPFIMVLYTKQGLDICMFGRRKTKLAHFQTYFKDWFNIF